MTEVFQRPWLSKRFDIDKKGYAKDVISSTWPGTMGIEKTFSARYDEEGFLDVVETGTEDLYELIQSHRDACDIDYIIKRYLDGETDILEKQRGFFGDITEYPKTYAELLNRVIESEAAFGQLPTEIKEKYGNNYVAWLQAAGSDDWLVDMGLVQPAEPVVPTDEVTSDEQKQ